MILRSNGSDSFSEINLITFFRLIELKDKGIFSQERCDFLTNVAFDNDLILHEAGVPPIHTPQKVLGKLSDDVSFI